MCGWPCTTVNASVFYRCNVEWCPLRYVQEVYCVNCAQNNENNKENGHGHNHMYMDDTDQYLVRYRQDVQTV